MWSIWACPTHLFWGPDAATAQSVGQLTRGPFVSKVEMAFPPAWASSHLEPLGLGRLLLCGPRRLRSGGRGSLLCSGGLGLGFGLLRGGFHSAQREDVLAEERPRFLLFAASYKASESHIQVKPSFHGHSQRARSERERERCIFIEIWVRVSVRRSIRVWRSREHLWACRRRSRRWLQEQTRQSTSPRMHPWCAALGASYLHQDYASSWEWASTGEPNSQSHEDGIGDPPHPKKKKIPTCAAAEKEMNWLLG